jgi:hypothetical protein
MHTNLWFHFVCCDLNEYEITLPRLLVWKQGSLQLQYKCNTRNIIIII